MKWEDTVIDLDKLWNTCDDYNIPTGLPSFEDVKDRDKILKVALALQAEATWKARDDEVKLLYSILADKNTAWGIE